MKSVEINGLEDFVLKHNPFVFRDENGDLMFFKTYEDLYYETLERLFKAGPYFIDMVLFVKDNVGMSFTDSKRFVNSWRSFGLRDDCYLFDWRGTDGVGFAKRDCREVLIGLHGLSETKFNESMYLSAFDRFVSGLTKRGEEEGRADYSQEKLD